jgi:hypothetical protein
MAFLFFFLVLASIVGLVIGLIKPTRVKMKSRKQVSWIFGGGIVLFFLLIGISAGQSQTPVASTTQTNNAVAAKATATPVATPQAPLTDKQKVQNAVQSLIENQSGQFPSIKAVDIQSDPSLPKGMTYVTIDIETGTFWDDSATVTETSQMTSQIMQQVFPINSTFHDVLVRYYGQLTDQYGNTSDGMMLSYDMGQTLYKKINWANFSNIQNDVHLCAFIREYFNTLDQATKDQELSQGSNSCTIMLKSLQKAENSIETSNPQFSDIPQYN